MERLEQRVEPEALQLIPLVGLVIAAREEKNHRASYLQAGWLKSGAYTVYQMLYASAAFYGLYKGVEALL